jgi:hypothetical protein
MSTGKVYSIDSLHIPKKDEELLEQFGEGLIESEIEAADLFEILTWHKQLLELETPNTLDLDYYKLRLWISQNLYQIIHEEDFLNTGCDQDVEDILKKFSWIIKYLVEISILVKYNRLEEPTAIKRFTRRLLYLFKIDIYFCNRTDSKVELPEIIMEVCKKIESSDDEYDKLGMLV